MNTPARYLITAALPYANGPLHIGHIAGAYLPADIYVRYLRMQKHDAVFVCGSDEHGVAITIQAKKEGLVLKRSLTSIMRSTQPLSGSWVLTLIFTTEHRRHYTTKLHRHSFGLYTTRVYLKSGKVNSFMMKSISSSWQTGT